MAKNKVRFGFSNIHIAFVTDEFDQGKPLYEDPIYIPGSVNFNLNVAVSENVFYAENRAYYTGRQDNGFTGEIEVAEFSDDILAKIFGWKKDKFGGVVEINNSIYKNFALGGQIEGDVNNRRFWLYNCSGSRPNESYKTTSESQEIKTQAMTLTVVPMDLGNGIVLNKYYICRDDDGIELYDKFFEKVYIPNLTETETTKANSKNTKDKVIGG